MRELERAAAAGDVDAGRRLVAERLRRGRDPRRDPVPGDVVEVMLYGWTRQDANGDCSDGWARSRRRVLAVPKRAKGLNTPHVVWVLDPTPEHPFGRANDTMQLRSWRRWAKDGRVIAIGGAS